MQSEFEEKEFETQINAELNLESKFVYGPGQVLENIIGIDVALLCQKSSFWKLFRSAPRSLYPYNRVPAGIQLNNSYWKELSESINVFPPFKFNLFLQHKRPNYLVNDRSSEWPYWGRPYYRYNITPHQQLALEALASAAQDEALVGYACPAFHTRAELWDAIRNGQIVSKTNFVHAASLSGHHAYTYIYPGAVGKGVACSERAEVQPFDFFVETRRLRTLERGLDNYHFVVRLGWQVEEALAKSGLERRAAAIRQSLSGGFNEITNSIIGISIFCYLTKTRWVIGVK